MFEQAFKNIDDVLWKDAGCRERGGVEEDQTSPEFVERSVTKGRQDR